MNRQLVTGKTKLAAILGNPLGHSISPIIHNHLFECLGIPAVYIPIQVNEEQLGNTVEFLKNVGFIGANVTIPFKSSVIKFCDELSELSKLTGTVNTLYMKNEKLIGTTTDFYGFRKSVESTGFKFENSNVVIIGNGGTGRTISMALASEKKINSLTVMGRNKEKVEILSNEVASKTGFPVRSELIGSDTFGSILENATLVVNTTPVGMSPDTDKTPINSHLINKNAAVFDAIYNPLKTKLLTVAEESGCAIKNGLDMLINQGLKSFEYWTGNYPDASLIDKAELAEMVKR